MKLWVLTAQRVLPKQRDIKNNEMDAIMSIDSSKRIIHMLSNHLHRISAATVHILQLNHSVKSLSMDQDYVFTKTVSLIPPT
jgi:hypothetical protein